MIDRDEKHREIVQRERTCVRSLTAKGFAVSVILWFASRAFISENKLCTNRCNRSFAELESFRVSSA